MKRIVLGALALLMATSMPGLAQTYRADSRDARQNHRIVRGAVNGELTGREARQLARQQHRIDRTRARAARDGVITRAERREIARQQDRASRNIHRKTHNNRTAY